MEKKPFYLKKVQRKKGSVWTVSFINEETGEMGKYIVVSKVRDFLGLSSTKYKTINKYKAIEISNIAVDQGFNTFNGNRQYSNYTFEEYFKLIWDFEESPYIKEKNYIKQKVGIDYARNNYRLFDNHMKNSLPNDIKLNKVKTIHLEKIFSSMREKNCSINLMVNLKLAIRVVFKYAYRMEIIYKDPSAKFGNNVSTIPNKEKGIITNNELKLMWNKLEELFNSGKFLESKYAAIKLAYFTGMRSSEIRALNVSDISPFSDVAMKITVRHSLENKYTLKGTKGGKLRIVLVPIELGKILIKLGANDPSQSGVVIWTPVRTAITPQFVNCNFLSHGFYLVLNEIGITEEIRKERNISFHSLRHLYVTNINNLFGLANAQALIGHADTNTTQIYTHTTDEIMNRSLSHLKDNLN